MYSWEEYLTLKQKVNSIVRPFYRFCFSLLCLFYWRLFDHAHVNLNNALYTTCWGYLGYFILHECLEIEKKKKFWQISGNWSNKLLQIFKWCVQMVCYMIVDRKETFVRSITIILFNPYGKAHLRVQFAPHPPTKRSSVRDILARSNPRLLKLASVRNLILLAEKSY